MSEYYKAQNKMFQYLEKIVKTCEETQTEIDLKTLMYDLTLNFAVSEKAIKNRIETIVELKENLIKKEDCLQWVTKK